jgi:hypothetical protein
MLVAVAVICAASSTASFFPLGVADEASEIPREAGIPPFPSILRAEASTALSVSTRLASVKCPVFLRESA